jgi:ERCC4-type nuclease
MTNLYEELQTVEGVGEATAHKIMEILGEQDPEYDEGYMDKAKQAAESGNYNTAGIYLRRAWE